MNNLVDLSLNGTDVSDVGMVNARIADKRRLHHLSLLVTRVSDGTLTLIERLPELDYVACGATNVTIDAVEHFKQVRPHVDVLHQLDVEP
jgi:hypothetical protein